MVTIPLDLRCVLGEFYPYYTKPCMFNQVARKLIDHGQANVCIGYLANAKVCYDYLLLYIEAVKGNKEIREEHLRDCEIDVGYPLLHAKRDIDKLMERYLAA